MLKLLTIAARTLRLRRNRKADYFRAHPTAVTPLRTRDKIFDVSLARVARTFAVIDEENDIGGSLFQFFFYRGAGALLPRIQNGDKSTIRNLEIRPPRTVRFGVCIVLQPGKTEDRSEDAIRRNFV